MNEIDKWLADDLKRVFAKFTDLRTLSVDPEPREDAEGEALAATAPEDGLSPREGGLLDFGPKYIDVTPLSRTHLSDTYLALNRDTLAQVVLKSPRIEHLMDDAMRARFQAEIQITAGLDHPHIVHIQETHLEGRRWWFSMPYLEGVHLDEFSQNGSLTMRQRLEVFLKICDAVEHAHRQQVIHRDLKPNNVIVGPDHEPRLLDFGLGLNTRDLQSYAAEDGRVTGALGYMSPEQAAGDPGNARTDVYGLGTLLFVLLTACPPRMRAESAQATLERIRNEDPPSPQRLDPSIGCELDAIVRKAMAKNPARRYETASALAGDTRKFLARKRVSAHEEKLGNSSRRALYAIWAGMRCRPVEAVAAFVVFSLGIAMAGLAMRNAFLNIEARTAKHVHSISRGRMFVEENDPANAAKVLWGAYFESAEPDLRTRYALWELYRRYPCIFAEASGPVLDVAFSHDDRWLVAVILGKKLLIWDTASWEVVESEADFAGGCLAFAPNESVIYAGGDDGILRRRRIQTQGKIVDLQSFPDVRISDAPIRCLTVSDAADRLVFGCGIASKDDVTKRWTKRGCAVHTYQVLPDATLQRERTFPCDTPVMSIDLNEYADVIAVGTQWTEANPQGKVVLLEATTLTPIAWHDSGPTVYGLQSSTADSTLLIGTESLHRWTWEPSAPPVAVGKLIPQGIRALDRSPWVRTPLVGWGSGAGVINWMSATTGRKLSIAGFHSDCERNHVALHFAHDRGLMASGGPDGLRIWRCHDGNQQVFEESWQGLPRVDITSSGERVIAIDEAERADRILWRWNRASHASAFDGLTTVSSANDLPKGRPRSILLVDEAPHAIVAGRAEDSRHGWLAHVHLETGATWANALPHDSERDWFVNEMTWLDRDERSILLSCSDGAVRVGQLPRSAGPMGIEISETRISVIPDSLFGECTHVDATDEWIVACSEMLVDPERKQRLHGRVVMWRTERNVLAQAHPLDSIREVYAFDVPRYTWRVAILFGPKGQPLVATSGGNEDVRIYDPASGTMLRRLVGHSRTVRSTAALNDRVLATAAEDGTVRLWDAWNGEELCILHEQPERWPIIAVCNGRIVVANRQAVRVIDSAEIDAFIDGNKHFERQRWQARSAR
jgi:WD40 repeat protein